MKQIKDSKQRIKKLYSLAFPKEWGMGSHKRWINYLKYGFNQEDVADLISIATDRQLIEDDNKISAAIHAWRTLAQLKAQDAIEPLINAFDLYEELSEIVEYICYEEIPVVMGMLGENAIEKLYECLMDKTLAEDVKKIADESLEKIAEYNRGNKKITGRVVEKLVSYLNDSQNYPELNGSAICSLLKLNEFYPLPSEAVSAIIQAYKKELVDISYAGDLEDIEIELGLRKKRSTERPLNELQKILMENNLSVEDLLEDDPFISNVKIGRNDKCPCGSGKKYKKCCLPEIEKESENAIH